MAAEYVCNYIRLAQNQKVGNVLLHKAAPVPNPNVGLPKIGLFGQYLTLARIRCFATFGRTGRGVRSPPWRFQTKRRRA